VVHRNTDSARDVLSRTKDTSTRVDDLVRATGRGVTAIRDSAGNALVMNGAAPYPLLTPVGSDAAVAFTPGGTVKITDDTTTQDRDMTVRDIASSGNVNANHFSATGDVTANGSFIANGSARFNGTMTAGNVTTGDANLQNVFANGTLNSTGFTFVGGGLKVGAAYDTVGGRITSRELTTVGNMACDGNIYLKGSVIPNSDERLKRHFADVDGALQAFRDVDWRSWEWLPGPTTEDRTEPVRHVMATAQAMQAHPLLRSVVRDATGPGHEDEDVLGFDPTDLLGYAGAALHEAGDRIAELETRVETQAQQLADLTAKVETLMSRAA
jgi:hypothetical protein